MSDEELHDELITLLIAGHETTAFLLTWALYWIHYLPEVEGKLRSHLSALGVFDGWWVRIPLTSLLLPWSLCLSRAAR